MSERKLNIIKSTIDNIVVSAILSFASAILTSSYDMYILWTTLLGFVVSTLVTVLIPANKICNAIAKLLKIKPNSFASGAIGGLVTNLYFSPILTFSCKLLIFAPDFNMVLEQFIKYAGIMYVISYFAFQITFNVTLLIFNKIKNRKEEVSCN